MIGYAASSASRSFSTTDERFVTKQETIFYGTARSWWHYDVTCSQNKDEFNV